MSQVFAYDNVQLQYFGCYEIKYQVNFEYEQFLLSLISYSVFVPYKSQYLKIHLPSTTSSLNHGKYTLKTKLFNSQYKLLIRVEELRTYIDT